MASPAPESGFSPAEWAAAKPWPEFLAAVREKRDIWESALRRVVLDEWMLDRLHDLPGPRRVLVLTEDWCGDAARSVPVLATALDAADGVEHRYLESDDHPDALLRHLTHGGRSIPIAIVQDGTGRPLGWWGPRPSRLQALVRARLRDHGRPPPGGVGEWYAPIFGWYGQDRGRSVIEEILMILERGGRPR